MMRKLLTTVAQTMIVVLVVVGIAYAADEVMNLDRRLNPIMGALSIVTDEIRRVRSNDDGILLVDTSYSGGSLPPAALETKSISGTFTGTGEQQLLAAQSGKRYKVVSCTVVSWDGEGHGSVHWGATESSTNKIAPIAAGETGGLLKVTEQSGQIGADNTAIYVNVAAIRSAPLDLDVVVEYIEIAVP